MPRDSPASETPNRSANRQRRYADCQRQQHPDLDVELEHAIHAVYVALDPVEVEADDERQGRAGHQQREGQVRGVGLRGADAPDAHDQQHEPESEREWHRAADQAGDDHGHDEADDHDGHAQRERPQRGDAASVRLRQVVLDGDRVRRPPPHRLQTRPPRRRQLYDRVGADDEDEQARDRQELPEDRLVGRRLDAREEGLVAQVVWEEDKISDQEHGAGLRGGLDQDPETGPAVAEVRGQEDRAAADQQVRREVPRVDRPERPDGHAEHGEQRGLVEGHAESRAAPAAARAEHERQGQAEGQQRERDGHQVGVQVREQEREERELRDLVPGRVRRHHPAAAPEVEGAERCVLDHHPP